MASDEHAAGRGFGQCTALTVQLTRCQRPAGVAATWGPRRLAYCWQHRRAVRRLQAQGYGVGLVLHD